MKGKSIKKPPASFPVPGPDLIELFLRPLAGAGIDTYMVSGSIAAIEFGEPRATLDIDVAIALDADSARMFPDLFLPPEYYCPPSEVVQIEVRRPTRGHFNVIHVPTGLKADFYPSRSHPYFDWAMHNRLKLDCGEGSYWFAPPEYVVLWKLEFYREGGEGKHLRDIRGILEVSGARMDLRFLDEAARKLRLESEWNRARAH